MAKTNRKLPSYHMLMVIGSILLSEEGERWGKDITDLLGIKPGTLYPLLHSLLDAEILINRKEKGDPKKLERPLRTYYSLTDKGKRFGKRYNTALLA